MDQFIKTPNSSDIDLFIENFKLEVGSSEAETRRLTVANTMSPNNSGSTRDIDQQITDLENLIRKLQDEINEMSKNADQQVEYDPLIIDNYDISSNLSHETIILEKPEDSESLRHEMKRDIRTDFESEQFSHVFPLMLRDVILPLETGLKISNTPSDRSDLDRDGRILENVSNIPDILDIWRDLPEDNPQENLEGLIGELQAKISEQMELMKDVIVEEMCNDPDPNFEDA